MEITKRMVERIDSREETQVLSCYELWRSNLISNDVFFNTLTAIKNSVNGLTRATEEQKANMITSGQWNYIQRLQKQGVIPQTQTLNLTKSEAQILIKSSLEKWDKGNSNKSEGVTDYSAHTQQAQTGSEREISKIVEPVFETPSFNQNGEYE